MHTISYLKNHDLVQLIDVRCFDLQYREEENNASVLNLRGEKRRGGENEPRNAKSAEIHRQSQSLRSV